jgi:hypothetical protein
MVVRTLYYKLFISLQVFISHFLTLGLSTYLPITIHASEYLSLGTIYQNIIQ